LQIRHNERAKYKSNVRAQFQIPIPFCEGDGEDWFALTIAGNGHDCVASFSGGRPVCLHPVVKEGRETFHGQQFFVQFV
jgi:hypothetical protein